MSFGKKLKRKKEAQVRKIARKVTSSIVSAKEQGRAITKKRKLDMFYFYQAKILTAASYIMNTQFGWTLAKLEKVAARFKYFVDDLILGGPKNGHVYLTSAWLAEGLELECDYKVGKPKKPDEPEELASVEAWVKCYHKTYGEKLCTFCETVWLWILHETFGFGRKRLEKFHKYFAKFDPVNAPMKMVYNAMDQLETLRTWKKIDGKCGKIELIEFRTQLARLDVDGNGFADGLNLMVPARKAV